MRDVCPLLRSTVSGHSKPGQVAEDAATMVEEGACYISLFVLNSLMCYQSIIG